MKYYSENTKKLYDSIEELEAADKEFADKEEAEKRKKEERAVRAKEVEDAYKKANEAMKDANAKLEAFCKDYGTFRTSISTPVRTSLLDEFFFGWPF